MRMKFLKIKCKQIVNFLTKNNIYCKTVLDDNFLFSGLSSILKAEKNYITFFSCFKNC